jgi:hypothetical protein
MCPIGSRRTGWAFLSLPLSKAGSPLAGKWQISGRKISENNREINMFWIPDRFDEQKNPQNQKK